MKNSLLAGRDFMPVQLELNRSFGEINYPFDELLNGASKIVPVLLVKRFIQRHF